MNDVNKNYCPDLFTGLFLEKETSETTRVAHCCVAKLSEPSSNVSLAHPHLEKSRNHFLETGELPESCNYCKSAEELGLPTSRTDRWRGSFDLSFPADVKLEKLDYNCDNVCNLKCIMCGSHYSSAWLEDEVKLGMRTDARIKHTKHNKLIETLDVSHLKIVYFNGGEPLMTRDHINVLNHIIKTHPNPSEVKVLYSSNGTIRFTEEIVDLWSKFKQVNLGLSIDAIGDCFEYVRFGADWVNVEQTLLSYQKTGLLNLKLKIQASVGLHNVLYLDDLFQWTQNNNYDINLQHDVRGTLSTLNFPKKHFNTLHDYVQGLHPNIKTQANKIIDPIRTQPLQSNRWLNWFNRVDAVRGNNWKKSLSRLYNLDPEYFEEFNIA